MNCDQCLQPEPFFHAPLHAVKSLGNDIARAWRIALEMLFQLG